MKQGLTELVFLLDGSGSMKGLEDDTIGGFNAMLQKQQRESGEALVTTVVFSTRCQRLHDRAAVGDVPPLTQADYVTGGCTALIDAIGSTITHIRNIHRYAREEDIPEHTVFVITTDGLENASRTWSSAAVKEMILRQQEAGWEFLFLGANIDAVETAGALGIGEDRAVTYRSDPIGTRLNYQVLSQTLSHVRQNRPMTADWKRKILRDRKRRGLFQHDKERSTRCSKMKFFKKSTNSLSD